jgi:serine/threonine protein kinase
VNTWTVPGYTDIRELGQSGSSRTMLGSHVATGVRVTIRYLPDDLRQDAAYLNRYRAEARLLCDVESPNVAELYEYVEASDGVAAVREYVAGASLRALLVSSSSLHPEAALTVLKGGLLGLAAAHARGATHGRFTPENVLIASNGHTKLADFGAAAVRCSPAEDVSAALATFLLCLTGSPAVAGTASAVPRGKVPKRLRALESPTFTGSAELQAELESVAGAAYGDSWETQGRRRLAQRVNRSLQRRRPGR